MPSAQAQSGAVRDPARQPRISQLGPRIASLVKTRARPGQSDPRLSQVRAGSGKGELALLGPALVSLDKLEPVESGSIWVSQS